MILMHKWMDQVFTGTSGPRRFYIPPPEIEATRFKNKHCIFLYENKKQNDGTNPVYGSHKLLGLFSSPTHKTCPAYLMYVLYVFVQFHFPVFKKP